MSSMPVRLGAGGDSGVVCVVAGEEPSGLVLRSGTDCFSMLEEKEVGKEFSTTSGCGEDALPGILL